MSLSRKHTRRRATIIGAVVGLVIIITFVIGLIDPGRGRDNNDKYQYPTVTPYGTPPPPTPLIIPTPDPDPQLTGELPYIHYSGLFQTFRPAGDDWYVDDMPSDEPGNRLGVVFQSVDRLTVIHNYVQPGVEYDSPDSLSDNYLTTDYYALEWSNYDGWTETNRQVTGDSVIIDFSLTAEDHNYLGRDIAALQDGWLYVTRLVAPDNNPALIDLLQTLVTPVFVGYDDLRSLPQIWPAYADQLLGYVIKYPPGWHVVAGAQGRPTTFSTPTGQIDATVQLWVEPDQPLESAADAEVWLYEADPTASALDTVPLEQSRGAGYQVAYDFRDSDGDHHSGLVVLLNDEAGTLFVANLQLDAADVNLLDVENLSAEQDEARKTVAEGFMILPPDARAPLMGEEPAVEGTQEAE
ncbi:MAG: hypothetical protein JXJ20_09720 [Anaerolineae bacterium]|nr:hypothetical protein [Anaerolineae bacterium]